MPGPKQVSKQVSKESSRAVVPIRRALSIQSLSEAEDPWEGVTLNRCLVVAVIVLVISSSIQCLNEALEAFGREAEESGAVEGGALSITPEEESSVWESLFWWRRAQEDDDDDDDDQDTAEKPRRKKAQGEFVRVRQKEKPWKGILVEKEDGEVRGKREKERGRWQEEEEGRVRGKKDRRRDG